MTPALVIGVAVAYLLALFGVAILAERSRKTGATWIHHPIVYALALGIHFTGWGYFASGAALFNQGLGDLFLSIGATLSFALGWPLLMRIIRLCKAQRVTTIPELLTVRFGPVPALRILASLLLIAAALFYVAIQLATTDYAIRLLIVEWPIRSVPVTGLGGMLLALSVALIAILFGARRVDPNEHHEGLVAALALDGVVKFVALGAVALFVVFAFPNLFQGAQTWPSLELVPPANPYPATMAYLLVGMASAILLPRMFHVAVVENVSPRQVFLARWFFPLYIALMTAFTAVIAWGGSRLGFAGAQLEGAPIAVPELAGAPALALLGYLGGISASFSMMIISLVAMANVVTTNLVLPLLSGQGERLGPWLRPIRWAVILVLALLSWGVWIATRVDYLNEYGFLAMIATAQLAPAVFLGILWPRLTSRPVTWGLGLALLVWLYTGVVPAIADAVPGLWSLLRDGPWGLAFLRPTALFGMTGWDSYAHCFFWSILVNLGATWGLSLRMPEDLVEEARVGALLEGTNEPPSAQQRLRHAVAPGEEVEFLSAFVGEERAAYELAEIQARVDALDLPVESRRLMVRDAVERVLRGPLGHDGASRVMQDRFPVTEQILPDVMEAFQKLAETLQANEEELALKVRELSFLKESADILVTQTEPQPLARAICGLIRDEFQLEHVGIFLLDDAEGLHLVCGPAFGLHSERLEVPPASPLIEALRHRDTRLIRAEEPPGAQDPLIRSSACREVAYVPIVFEHEPLGVLAVGARARTVHLSDAFLRLMRMVAHGLAIALANATLRADLEDRVRARTEELARERDRLAKANEKLSKAIDDLRNLDRVKGTFLNAVSHDLRIPLTGILGYAEFLEDEVGGHLSDQQQDFARQITHEAYRMTGLLNELLDFARMEAGKFKIEPRAIVYPEPLNSAVNTFRPAIQKKGLEVRVDLPPDLPMVHADPERVIQVLSNLLSNALKFTPEGGCITVRAYREGDWVVTEVSDTGVGISADELPHMFERFYQTEAGKAMGGTGLGLSITKSLVEAHGGTIEVDSRPGKGTTFRFTLPVAKGYIQ